MQIEVEVIAVVVAEIVVEQEVGVIVVLVAESAEVEPAVELVVEGPLKAIQIESIAKVVVTCSVLFKRVKDNFPNQQRNKSDTGT
jgi:hypothetical protein